LSDIIVDHFSSPPKTLLSTIIEQLKSIQEVDDLDEIIHVEDVIDFEMETEDTTNTVDPIERASQLVCKVPSTKHVQLSIKKYTYV
jgi:hypothetical protein